MFDLTPLYQSTVGFDRLADMLGDARAFEAPSYPPYNIERLGENDYRITMAVAGFSPDEIEIEVKEQTLKISGAKKEQIDNGSEFLHRGIATRNFERQFQLADHVKVSEASMEDGLLHVTLKREIPEAMKPRKIKIATPSKKTTIEGKKTAA